MKLKGARVLVTGAGGFIGSHLTEGLLGQGCKVTALVRYTSHGSAGWLESIPRSKQNKIGIFRGDIRDSSTVKLAAKGMDVIFHLAALIGIPYSYRAPQSYLETNVGGTHNILEAAKELGTRRVIVTSTSEVYGTAQRVPIDESHPHKAQSPYSASKIAADALAESYHLSFSLPVSIVRPFNTYGPRQSSRAVIPTLITQCQSGKSSIRIGSLHPTRDFVYVKDTVQGFVAVAESEEASGRTLNIATGKEISVGELANMVLHLTGSKAKLRCEAKRRRPKNSEVERLLGDPSKLRDLTRWKQRYSLERGLKETISWFNTIGKPSKSATDRYWV